MSTPDSLVGRVFHHAETNPEHPAIVNAQLSVSYAELRQWVLAQAAQLVEMGVMADSVVGIRCADDVQHLVLCVAAAKVGAASCTLPSYETGQKQSDLLERCGVTHVLGFSSNFEANPKAETTHCSAFLNGDTDAELYFSTSGTTGKPKLVVHKSGDLVAQAHRHIGSRNDRFACLASVEHNFSKRHRLYCLAMGATNVFICNTAETLVAECQKLAVTVLHVSAFQARELLAVPGVESLAEVRLKLGGSLVPMPLRQQLREKITSQLYAGYGTTETGAIAFTDPDDLDASETVGQPLEGIEVRVVDSDGKAVAVDEHGELLIRGKGMFRGYLDSPELTSKRLRNGWFNTGDIGYVDSDGRITLCGRSDDMFMFNSMNIYPQDIESQICNHTGVLDAAVLPKASPVHGNIPVALVVFSDGAELDLKALKKFVRERVGLRCPRQFMVVDHIPRNTTGKIMRSQAQSLLANSLAGN